MKTSTATPQLRVLLITALVLPALLFAATPSKSLHWTKRNLFVAPFENCTTADLNKDGHIDIIYGPYWFAGPDFVPRAYRAHMVGNNYHRNNSDHI